MTPLPRATVIRASRSLVLGVVAVLVFASVAFGVVTPAVLVSGPSPFAACPDGQTAGPPPGEVFVNAEVEPWVAVNPTNPTNLVGVWQQDRWTDGGSKGLGTARSTDGGATWAAVAPIPWSTCGGSSDSEATRATDPWVSFGPDGTAHQIALALDPNGFMTAILASRSTDGGATWSAPATLIRDDDLRFFNDKESITADPTDADLVYAVWDRIYKPGQSKGFPSQLNSFAFRGAPYLARSTDGGATWEAARRISSNANLFTIGNQIVVLPGGTLIDFTDYATGSGLQPANHDWKAVFRSTDHGVTWSKPVIIAQVTEVAHRIPDGSFPVRAGGDDIAVDPVSGDLYAVWTDGRFNDGSHDDIVLSKSSDGGLTWSAPAKVSGNPTGVDAHTPSVEVNAGGQVAVAWYDYRNDVSGDTAATTDYWNAISVDGAETWSEQRLTSSSFDISKAPVAPASRGYFLGDYMGLASRGSTFANLYVVTTGDTANRNEVVFQNVTQP
jgi:BNR/Asp-box repeat